MKWIVVSIASLACLTMLAAPAHARAQHEPTPEQRFFDWTAMRFSKEVYRARRERMIARLGKGGGGLFLVPGRYGVSEGFTFRQLDDFLYFTGLELPDSILVLDADEQRAILFSPEEDSRFASSSRPNDFPGRLLGADPSLPEMSGIETIRPVSELPAALSEWVSHGRGVSLDLGGAGALPEIESGFIAAWTPAEALLFHLQQHYPKARLRNAFEEVARLRMIKGPEEIEALRRVAELTVVAIRHAAGFIRDGIDERGLEAELEAAFKRGGSQRLAFASIIKSGPNSLWPWRILAASYDRRNRKMRPGELVIFDVGTELDGYVSDVGRTFPVSGRFLEKHKRALRMVTAVSDAVLAAVHPGVTLARLKDVAVSKIPPQELRYMQAGGFYGHHLGLSSGDPFLEQVPLEPGMVFTVEPWYYNHDEDLAVFIEDVVLVTANGHENLTAKLPRSIEALEAMTSSAAARQER